jgi:hypothetical protein
MNADFVFCHSVGILLSFSRIGFLPFDLHLKQKIYYFRPVE